MPRRRLQLLLISLAAFSSMGAMCGWGAPIEGLATHCPPKTVDCGPGCIAEGSTCCDDTPTGGMSQCQTVVDGGVGEPCTRRGEGSCPASGLGKYCCGQAGSYKPSTDVGTTTFNGVAGVFCGNEADGRARVIEAGSACCFPVEGQKPCRYTGPRGGGTGGGGGSGGSGGIGGSGGVGGGGLVGPPCSINLTGQCSTNTFCYVTSSTTAPSGVCLGGCDVVTQNCAGTTNQCTYGTNSVRGCYANGTVPERGDCGTLGCVKGTVCIRNQLLLDGGTGSACAKFCRINSDCVSPRQCNTSAIFTGNNERPQICQPCSPLTQNCFPSSLACYQTTSGLVCNTPGTKTVGQSCSYANECVKGSVCLGATNSVCRKFCNTSGGTPTCTTGSCSQLTGSPPGVGACF